MELLLVPVPLFDKYMGVEAYLLRYRVTDQNILLPLGKDAPIIRALEEGKVEAFAGGNQVFVPVTPPMLPELLENFNQTPQITTLLLEDFSTPLDKADVKMLSALREKGYTIAVAQETHYVDDDSLLVLADYVVFSERAMGVADRRALVVRYHNSHKHLRVMATCLADDDAFQQAGKDGFDLFEGQFYRIPITREDRELSPMKMNLIQLLNMVRDENFEFRDIAEVVRRDPALSYSLMRFINSPYLGIRNKVKSVQHAVTILGQIEVRKWVTAAVFRELGADRPSELTRIALVRARFAEDLAGPFELAEDSSSLFLMGMFSALDAMLDCSMEEALSKVQVSDEIADALLREEGRYYKVLQFVRSYEQADWSATYGNCMVHALRIPEVYAAYLGAVGWYHELITTKLGEREEPKGIVGANRLL